MSPLMLVLLVMFIPPDEPICLFFILDAKSLSATTIDRGSGEDREERTGQRREEASGCEKVSRWRTKQEERTEEEKKDRTGEGQEMKVWGEKEKRTEFRYRSS